ncbi:MAG: flagellar export chaperone FliS [Deltaproteobacteria bacterium]|jgi:flagellar protein FliS|nr:flagellar export chaperone FliS [Deltaproteobacteria bacterium]
MITFQQNTASRYQQVQFDTADRGRILLMMFDGALRFLTQAEAGLREDRLDQFATSLARAQAVVAELLHTLDHKAGGQVAVDLERLYRFMLDHLVEANLRKSAVHVSQVRGVLSIISDAFHEIVARAPEPMRALDAA